MSESSNEEEIVITLLSNGSSEIFRNNSLTSFSNKLHSPIVLNPSNHNYIALQEIGISLSSGNIQVPNDKPTLIYFEWDVSLYLFFNPDFSEDLTDKETYKKTFLTTYERNQNNFFVNYSNDFGIFSTKYFLENKIYTTKTIEEELKEFKCFSNEEGNLNIALVSDYLKETFDDNINIPPSLLQQFQIKRNSLKSESIFDNEDKLLGIIVHENFAKALKIETYSTTNLSDNTQRFEVPNSIFIHSEKYLVYFLSKDEKLRGGLFFDNTIGTYNDNVINIDCNIVYPYISNEKFCSTLATFNNITNNQKFLYYYPNNRTYYKLKGNEIQDISIRISDKDYNQLSLFEGIPTITKLIIKSQVKMDFTSNLRVSSKASGTSNFKNKNSFFRVVIPTNDIFQSEKSQISVSSITYPNRFKLLPEYLNAKCIRTYFMYSNENIISSEMEITSSSENDSAFSKDITSDLSLDPLTLINNFNKRFEKEKIEWLYNNQSQRTTIKTNKHAYILQIPCPLGYLLGFQDSDVSFSNNMIRNHLFKDSWFYKVFWTEKFIDVMKTKNNLSIYEILANNNFSTTNFFYIALSSHDEYQIKRPINLELHRPRYALVYNNIIEDSIVDNNYYKVLKTIYFEDSDSKWKTITYKNDEYKNVCEKTPLYLEFMLRLPSGDEVEFENMEDEVVINLKTKSM